MEKAEVVILRLVHSDAFSKEIAALGEVVAENHNDPRAKSRRKKIKVVCSLFRLDPFIDINGLLRVGGRLRELRCLSEDLMHPVILPKKGHITTLVIRHSHKRVAHAGTSIINGYRRFPQKSLMQTGYLNGIEIHQPLHIWVEYGKGRSVPSDLSYLPFSTITGMH